MSEEMAKDKATAAEVLLLWYCHYGTPLRQGGLGQDSTSEGDGFRICKIASEMQSM